MTPIPQSGVSRPTNPRIDACVSLYECMHIISLQVVVNNPATVCTLTVPAPSLDEGGVRRYIFIFAMTQCQMVVNREDCLINGAVDRMKKSETRTVPEGTQQETWRRVANSDWTL